MIDPAKIEPDLVMADDGYYVYWPELSGYLDAPALRQIADMLDAKNKGWHERVMGDESI